MAQAIRADPDGRYDTSPLLVFPRAFGPSCSLSAPLLRSMIDGRLAGSKMFSKRTYALSRDYVSRLMEMRPARTSPTNDPNLPRRNCFSRGFSRVVVFFFFASAVGHRWGSIMLESLKASLFLFSFFFSSPPSFWKKRHPLLLLVAPRNSALPYQIFISPTKGERKRERIPLFVHRIVFSLSNFVRS